MQHGGAVRAPYSQNHTTTTQVLSSALWLVICCWLIVCNGSEISTGHVSWLITRRTSSDLSYRQKLDYTDSGRALSREHSRLMQNAATSYEIYNIDLFIVNHWREPPILWSSVQQLPEASSCLLMDQRNYCSVASSNTNTKSEDDEKILFHWAFKCFTLVLRSLWLRENLLENQNKQQNITAPNRDLLYSPLI